MSSDKIDIRERLRSYTSDQGEIDRMRLEAAARIDLLERVLMVVKKKNGELFAKIQAQEPAVCVATAYGQPHCIGRCENPKDCCALPLAAQSQK